MPIDVDRSSLPPQIRLTGRVDIQCAAELQAALLAAAEGGAQIDASQATELDVTAVQLLWAAENAGIALQWTGSWTNDLVTELHAAGLALPGTSEGQA